MPRFALAFAAVLCACPVQAATDEDDSTCLLQSSMVTASLQTDVATRMKKHRRNDEPSKGDMMLNRVKKIVDHVQSSGTQPSDSEAQMVEGMASMINEISLPALVAGLAENQRQVDSIGVAVNSCEVIRSTAENEIGGVAERRSLVAYSRTAHRECRIAEGELEADRAARCGNFQDYARALQPPSGDIPADREPSSPLETFLTTNDEWFHTKHAQYLVYKEQCDRTTELHLATKTKCDANQTAFETASCALPSAQHGMCGPYNTCRDNVDGQILATLEDVKAVEEQRKKEYIVLQKIKCLISTIVEPDAETRNAAIDACHVEDLTIHYDGSIYDPGMLNVTYPAVAARSVCSDIDAETPLMLPCGNGFLEAEYAVPILPELAPAAACTPCIGVPISTPATTTTATTTVAAAVEAVVAGVAAASAGTPPAVVTPSEIIPSPAATEVLPAQTVAESVPLPAIAELPPTVAEVLPAQAVVETIPAAQVLPAQVVAETVPLPAVAEVLPVELPLAEVSPAEVVAQIVPAAEVTLS